MSATRIVRVLPAAIRKRPVPTVRSPTRRRSVPAHAPAPREQRTRIAALRRLRSASALPPRTASADRRTVGGPGLTSGGVLPPPPPGFPPPGLPPLGRGLTRISTLPALGCVVASPAYSAVRVLVPAEANAPVSIVTSPSTSVPLPSTASPDFSCTSPVGAAPSADTVTVTLLPRPTMTCGGLAAAVVVESRSTGSSRSRICTLRKKTSSPEPCVCRPM